MPPGIFLDMYGGVFLYIIIKIQRTIVLEVSLTQITFQLIFITIFTQKFNGYHRS